MTQTPNRLSARRVTLMASVAGLGLAVLLTGPSAFRAVNGPAWTNTAVAAENMLQPTGFADIVAKVKPAVISVRIRMDAPEKTASLDDNDDNDQAQPGAPMERFFRQFGFKQFGLPDGMPNGTPRGMTPRSRPVSAEGSGFFISADGYAVTNNHVVDHAKTVQVVTDDGRTLNAKVIGTDAKTDLALIKVEGNDFPFVRLSDRDPRIGDWVIAVGNPFGLGGTVTAGIVSARGRDIGAGPYDDYVQIDAPINKGNSGGPAFDTNGNVIGVNTAIFSPSGGSVGIGFDIPASTAKLVVAQLKDKGYVTRGWLGVQVQPVTADIADSLGMKQARGAMVENPQDGSPAAKAGLEAGDVITAVNGAEVKDARDLARNISSIAPGSSIKLDILHKGDAKTVTVALAEMPGDHQANAGDQQKEVAGTPRLGLQLAPAAEVDGSGDKGVVVTGVDPQGPAAEHGFQTGDIILNVGGKNVSNVGDVRAALSAAQQSGKNSVLMRVKTADATRFVAVPLAKG